MSQGILLQSLDSTRFEEKNELEFGLNMNRARKEVLTAFHYGNVA